MIKVHFAIAGILSVSVAFIGAYYMNTRWDWFVAGASLGLVLATAISIAYINFLRFHVGLRDKLIKAQCEAMQELNNKLVAISAEVQKIKNNQ